MQATIFEGLVVEDHTGNSLSSVRIGVRPAGSSQLLFETETATGGSFVIRGVAKGSYDILFSKPRYLSSVLSAHSDGSPSSKETLHVRLVRTAVISGRVMGWEGRPISGAAIYAMTRTGNSGPLLPVTRTETNQNGDYSVLGLAPGQYAVAVAASLGKAAIHPIVYPHGNEPVLLPVSGGEEHSGINFVISRAAGLRIAGKVELTTKTERFAVVLVSRAFPTLPVAAKDFTSDGVFAFEGIPHGSYDLLVSGPFVGGARGQSFLLGSKRFFGRAHLEVSGNNVEGTTVSITQGLSARFVLGPGYVGACGKVLVHFSPLEHWGAALERSLEVVRSGERSLEGLVPGPYRLHSLTQGCYLERDIVSREEVERGTTITIRTVPAGAIRGRLRTPSVVFDIGIVLTSDGDAARVLPNNLVFPDSAGRFTFESLRPGRYRIAAWPRSRAVQLRWKPDFAQMTLLDVAPGAATECDLEVSNQDVPKR